MTYTFLPRIEPTDVLADCAMSAIIGGSRDEFRYELRRRWDANLPLLIVCMLNPSTADSLKNDPTVLALMHFARSWGCGGVHIINLFAFRTSHPSELVDREDRIGPENGYWIEQAMRLASRQDGVLLVAWGNGGDLDDRATWFCSRAVGMFKLKLVCLGTTLQRHPKHPMARGRHRIPRDQKPIIWREPLSD